MTIPALLPVLVFFHVYMKDLCDAHGLDVSCFGGDDDIFDTTILLLAVLTVKNKGFIHSRNRKIFHKSLSLEMRRLRDRMIPRASLHDPIESAWHRLYLSLNDKALVTLTGFDHQAFRGLLRLFEPVYNLYSPGDGDQDGCIVRIRQQNRGRPRLLTASDCLGLNLAWTRLRGSTTALQLVFGMTGSRISKWLRYGRRLLILILCNHPDAAVRIPSAARIRQYKASIILRFPSLLDVWCTMDGLKLYLQQSGDSDMQNLFYNGWTHDH